MNLTSEITLPKSALQMLHNSTLERRPDADPLPDHLQAVACPHIAGFKKAVGAFGFIKAVVNGVARMVHEDEVLVFCLKRAKDIRNEALVLVFGNDQLFTGSAFCGFVALVPHVHGRGAETECGFEGSRELQVGPCGCTDKKSFIAPADADVRECGIHAFKIRWRQQFVPVELRGFYRQYKIGMNVIGFDVNGDTIRRRRGGGIDLDVGQYLRKQHVNADEEQDP